MRPLVVVVSREGVQEGPELGQVCGLGLGGEPFLEGLPVPLDLAPGLGVVRAAVLLLHPEAAQLVLQAVAAAPAAAPSSRAVLGVISSRLLTTAADISPAAPARSCYTA